jgi:uracil-DNA glycosylase
MNVSQNVQCKGFPCIDVRHEGYLVPGIEINTEDISILMISECAPADPRDDYYAAGEPLFQKTTVQAYNDAGITVSSVVDILKCGVYLTTAVKCGKTGSGITTGTIKECSRLLEKEIALFPRLKAFLLMGDVAIKALNYISGRAGEGRVIPAESTYKIRGGRYYFRGVRAFPSYLQAGPSFFIERSKRKMIAEDIAEAMALI